MRATLHELIFIKICNYIPAIIVRESSVTMCDNLFYFGRIYNQPKKLGVRGGSHMTHICVALRDLVPFLQFKL